MADIAHSLLLLFPVLVRRSLVEGGFPFHPFPQGNCSDPKNQIDGDGYRSIRISGPFEGRLLRPWSVRDLHPLGALECGELSPLSLVVA